MKLKLTFILFLLVSSLVAQSSYWKAVSSRSNDQESVKTFSLVHSKWQQLLQRAPMEFQHRKGLIVQLPLPNGELTDFQIWNSPIMAEGLAKRYPNIQSFKGFAIQNPDMVVRMGIAANNFQAAISSADGLIRIDADANSAASENIYKVGYHHQFSSTVDGLHRQCGHAAAGDLLKNLPAVPLAKSRNGGDPVDLYVYDLALACSGEFARYHNATTKEQVLAKFNEIMNRVNLVFERDLAIRLKMIEETDTIIFLDPDTDPYTDGNNVQQSYGENPTVIETRINSDNFDVGHVFIAGCGGGTVGIGGGNTCDASKSLGISCQFSNDANFAFNVVAHEFGHQFYASHSWNNCPGNEEQFASSGAYEPGSGSTIMSYAGSCGSNNNIQQNADSYFHVVSLQQILNDKLSGRTFICAERTPTTNISPDIQLPYENGFHIPVSTPFELRGFATDENGDALTYCWEQFNSGPSIDLGFAVGTSPAFRSFPPTTNPVRTFPRLNDLLNNRQDIREVMPDYSRNLTFRLTVRDNHPEAGGVDWETVSFQTTDQAGPFLVAYPNTSSDTVRVGEEITVRWDVANTNRSPVNALEVNILLSTDGGNTFTDTLLMNTPNDGSQRVTIPDRLTAEARIRIEASDNIFFDVSNADFTIQAPAQPGFSFTTSVQEQQVCLPELLTIDINTFSLLEYADSVHFQLFAAEDLTGGDFSFVRNTFPTGENTQLQIDLPADFPQDSLHLTIEGIAPNADTIRRSIQLEIVQNIFDNFAAVSPEQNTSGIGLAEFSWAGSANAQSYQIEIATSPDFGEHTIEMTSDLTDTFYVASTNLEVGKVYFWRVSPVNECGPGQPSELRAFQTASFNCSSVTATDVPILIPAQGTPTIESKINVTQDVIINDLNILKVKGSHNWTNHIEMTLISPDETEVLFFNRQCFGSIPFDVGFDDESGADLPCPPTGGGLHPPHEPLATFDGISSLGEWTLRIEVINTDGEGGTLDNWSLEFCSSTSPEPPVLITNETMTVKPQNGRLLTPDLLETTDPGNAANELTYTLVTIPGKGDLELNDQPLLVGSQFTQADLNNGQIKYRHLTDDTAGTDTFSFIVEDGEGGWVGITPFEIVLDELETITNTTEKELENQTLTVFPNPAQGAFFITWNNPAVNTTPRDGYLQLIDLQGRMLSQQKIQQGQVTIFQASELPAGLYWLRLQTPGGILTRKVVLK